MVPKCFGKFKRYFCYEFWLVTVIGPNVKDVNDLSNVWNFYFFNKNVCGWEH